MPVEANEGYVYRAEMPLTPQAVAELLKPFDGATAIVKRPDWSDMIRVEAAGAETFIEQWPEGQVFNPAAEMRWRKTGGGFAVLWLTEQATSRDRFSPVAGSPFTAVSPSQNRSHGFLLWGTPRDAEKEYWMETRIPRPLRYPGFRARSKKQPPRLAYRLYCDRETVRWVRLVELKEADDE